MQVRFGKEGIVSDENSLFWQIVNQTASITYAVFIASVAGGVRYLSSLRARVGAFRWRHLTVSFLVGGLNGYLMFLLCDEAGWSWQLTAFLTGASGAMGSEMLDALVSLARERIIFGGGNHGNGKG